MKRIIRLENLGRMKAAEVAAIEIPEGKVLGESALFKIAKQIEDMILARGGYGMRKRSHKTDQPPRLQASLTSGRLRG